MRRTNKQKRAVVLKISVCGVISALSYCLLAIGSIVEIFDFSAVVIASVGVVFCVVEMGYSYAALTCAVTSLISFLLLPASRFPALVYMLFGGIYPIIKSLAEKTKKPISILLKFLFSNASAALIWIITSWIMPETEHIGKLMLVTFVLLMNLAFWLYDVFITRIVTMYLYKWRRQLNIKDFDKL